MLFVVALVGFGVAFVLALSRLVRGPTLGDRAVAGDVCLASVLGMVAVVATRRLVTEFLDAIVVTSLVLFISTVAFAQLLVRRDDEG